MEMYFPDECIWNIQTKSNIFWIMQFTRNIFYIYWDKKRTQKRTIQFLKIVKKHNLCFKQSKCDFNAKKMPILKVVCYELRSLGLDNRTTLILSNTRELDRDSFTN